VTSTPIRLLAIPGSLRSGSFNRALARTLAEVAPEDVEVEVFELHEIPLYNQDLDTDERRPAPVRRLKGRIAEADGVILVSPEYNYGVPGVLKNAIDWASRPGFRSPMAGKPTGIMGASAGLSGTMRGQEHLKVNLLGMGAQVFAHPGVAVRSAGEKVDGGRIVHEATRDFVASYLADFGPWVRRVAP
jgi:chromate reductase